MGELRNIDLQDVIARAAAALSAASGKTVALDKVQPLSDEKRRNIIARAEARYDDGRVRSVIVKATRSPAYDPADENASSNSGLMREWVATAYIAAHAPERGHGGALLAGELANGILVFEDLGADSALLVGPLLKGTAEEAERALASYAMALARLHSDTVDCLGGLHATFQSIVGLERPRRAPGWRVEEDAQAVTKAIGGTAAPPSELALLSSRLSDPGPWLALCHGDPCPDNALLVDGRIRLIDYEWARPMHALLDGIYWRIGFPSCWCAGRVPTAVAARIDRVYRAELGRAVPPALDDRAYQTEAAHMAAVWLFTNLAWRLDDALKSDNKWGIWSIRGRLLSYLETVIEMTAAADVLPGTRETAASWLAQLRALWPDAIPLGLYPAFAAHS